MVEKTIKKVGHGRFPQRGQTVTLQVTGYLQSGRKKFWSTKDKYQKPYKYTAGIGKVIKGWDEGVMRMRLGERAELNITGDMGYGMKGFEAWNIPANAALIFDIEVLSIGEEINLPTPMELAKARMAKKHVFIDRSGDRMGDLLKFNSAPF